jgi:hypothetical protein
MYYTVYKVTNKINNKIYIGCHKTTDINDGYMGSGKHLTYSQNKYGIENFEKEILYVFDNATEMLAKEREIVNEQFVADQNTYNLRQGGQGGWDFVNTTGKNIYGNNGKTPNVKDNFARGRQTQTVRRQNDPNYAKSINEKISNSLKGHEGYFKGKNHTEESKIAIGKNSAIHQKGSSNSQYNTKWIFSLEEKRSMKIKKTDPLPVGWFEGRKISFK